VKDGFADHIFVLLFMEYHKADEPQPKDNLQLIDEPSGFALSVGFFYQLGKAFAFYTKI
jgi:hypothetical protein